MVLINCLTPNPSFPRIVSLKGSRNNILLLKLAKNALTVSLLGEISSTVLVHMNRCNPAIIFFVKTCSSRSLDLQPPVSSSTVKHARNENTQCSNIEIICGFQRDPSVVNYEAFGPHRRGDAPKLSP